MPATVIIGAGIIGVSTAYYLSQLPDIDPSTIHLVETTSDLFASASGKSGGFCAADWYGPSVSPLGLLSFKLHASLAATHSGRSRWGYSLSTGTSYMDTTPAGPGPRGEDWLLNGGSRAEVAGTHDFSSGNGPAWLTRSEGDQLETIGADASCAQVDPKRLCEFLLQEAREQGVRLHQPAEPVSITKSPDGKLTGITIAKGGEEITIPCSTLLVSAGAWTPSVFRTLFPSSKIHIPISPLAGHSLTLRSPRWAADSDLDCHAVFSSLTSGLSPEIFSRVGGEIYVAGLNSDSIPLPQKASDAVIDEDAIETLKSVGEKMLGVRGKENDLEVVRTGLCFRPVTPRGTPILSRVRDGELGLKTAEGGDGGGVFVAAGHGPWGISLSLGTGLVMAELMTGRKTSANVKRLAL
ncbi:hypothetical protein MBLNU457_6056t1 [Dothideomycetes sp. NU457]